MVDGVPAKTVTETNTRMRALQMGGIYRRNNKFNDRNQLDLPT
jgi:hypothetical protein